MKTYPNSEVSLTSLVRKTIGTTILACTLFIVTTAPQAQAQVRGEDAAPGVGLWRLPLDCDFPYQIPQTDEIEQQLQTIVKYIDQNSPVRWIDLESKQPIEAGATAVEKPGLLFGLFALTSYEWGVTYAAMLRAAEVTENPIYRDYVQHRFEAIESIATHYLAMDEDLRPRRYLAKGMITPNSLDSCGAMTAAMIKGKLAGIGDHLENLINPAIHYISLKQKRLEDGTLARNRPQPDSLWLDDLYMSIPALAQMGKLTGDSTYFDDACKQLVQMTERMYVPETGLYRHGWVQSMHPHPTFFWGRANGWTMMAAVELLSVLPKDHPKYAKILKIYRNHVIGITEQQGMNGFWHQLLDRPETYEETSATAMFVFSLARGINEGWIDAGVYGPIALLGWNAITTQMEPTGAINGTCVGTGMGWDKAFYAYRPVSPHAAHGYGPVILAGAEVIELLKTTEKKPKLHDGAINFGKTPNW